MKRKVSLFVGDIEDAIGKIERYTEGKTFGDFAKDEMCFDAVVKNIENIGEASKHIPENIKDLYSNIPWRRIKGMRNILAHEYFGLSKKIVWKVVRDDLIPLKSAIQKMFNELEKIE